MQTGATWKLKFVRLVSLYEPVKGLNVSPSFFVMTFVYEFIPDSLNMAACECLIKVR